MPRVSDRDPPSNTTRLNSTQPDHAQHPHLSLRLPNMVAADQALHCFVGAWGFINATLT